MKAIIMKIDGESAVALSDGRFISIRNHRYEVGQVLEIAWPKKLQKKFIALAVSAAAVAIATVSVFVYCTPYTCVSLDVNPSVEYAVNCFDRVVSVTGMNDDGKKVINNVSIKNKDIETAVRETVQEIVREGYIQDGETGEIVIATSSNDGKKSDEMAAILKSDAETAVSDEGLKADVLAQSVDKETVAAAHAKGVTPGKWNLAQQMVQSTGDGSNTIDEWLNKPVKDILKAVQDNPKAADNSPEQKNRSEQSSISTTEDSTAAPDNNQKENTTKHILGSEKENTENEHANTTKTNEGEHKTSTTITTTVQADACDTSDEKAQTNETKKDNGNANGKSKSDNVNSHSEKNK